MIERGGFPFRRALLVDPIILPINSATTPVGVAIDQTLIRNNGVTSFKLINPNPFWVWLRGWSGAMGDMPTIKEKGHYVAPGASDLNTSQIPQFLAVQAQAEPGVPLPADIATAGYRCILIYGSGI